MKISAIVVFSLTTAATLFAQSAIAAIGTSVCVSMRGIAPDRRTVMQAESLASKMFAAIGVTIVWHADLKKCPAGVILIRLSTDTPAATNPGILAQAFPYEGSHIFVFLDRISAQLEPYLASKVLAHVFVHEITHILEGINRHSRHGIMKAQWNIADLLDMQAAPLEFAKEDVDLIQAGLAARERRSMLATNIASRSQRRPPE